MLKFPRVIGEGTIIADLFASIHFSSVRIYFCRTSAQGLSSINMYYWAIKGISRDTPERALDLVESAKAEGLAGMLRRRIRCSLVQLTHVD